MYVTMKKPTTKNMLKFGVSVLLAGATMTHLTGCASSFAPPSADSSKEDRNVIEHGKKAGLANPVIVTDPRKEGTAIFHPPGQTEERVITVTPVPSNDFTPGKGKKRQEVVEATEFHERVEGNKIIAIGFSVNSEESTLHRQFVLLKQATDLDKIETAPIGQAIDGGSVALETALVVQGYAGALMNIGRAARDFAGISYDYKMAEAAKKEADAYDYWARHWSPDTYQTTVYGSTSSSTSYGSTLTSTIGDISANGYGGTTTSSVGDVSANGYGYGGAAYSYSNSKSISDATADAWTNTIIKNAIDVDNTNSIKNGNNGSDKGHGGDKGHEGCNDGCSSQYQPESIYGSFPIHYNLG